MQKTENSILLALETAIGSGSISLLRGEEELASLCGEAGISRAEDLIPNIGALLKTAGVARADVSRIAVSRGPGSYTGIRIGIATALGLAAGTEAEVTGVDVLSALAAAAVTGGTVIAAVPVGRTDVAWQEFGSRALMTQPSIASAEEFFRSIDRPDITSLVSHPEVVTRMPGATLMNPIPVIDTGANLARLIGIAAVRGNGSRDLTANYLLNPGRSRGLF